MPKWELDCIKCYSENNFHQIPHCGEDKFRKVFCFCLEAICYLWMATFPIYASVPVLRDFAGLNWCFSFKCFSWRDWFFLVQPAASLLIGSFRVATSMGRDIIPKQGWNFLQLHCFLFELHILLFSLSSWFNTCLDKWKKNVTGEISVAV